MPEQARHTLYQVSTATALVEGIYEGAVQVSTLRKHGDLGLGTFEGLDGEMVIVDGHFFQVRSDGSVREVRDNVLCPFAAVTAFSADQAITLDCCLDLSHLTSQFDALRPSDNFFYALRVDGTFDYIHARAMRRTNEGVPLVQAAAVQPEFEFQNISGTLVGFWTPEYAKSWNVPGYHLHFISADRAHGGHLLQSRGKNLRLQIQQEGVANAFRASESGRPGAAFISAPKDIMLGEADGEVLTPTAPASLGPADRAAIAAAADLVNKATNPVLMLGLLARGKNTADAVQGLIAKTNMPVVCTYQGAGVVPREHFHRFGGRVGLFRTQPADRILDAADLVITIGYDPIEFEPGLWNRGKKRDLVHIDVISADIDNDYRPQVELVGNIGATVGALIDQVNAGASTGSAELLREVAIERSALGKKAAALNGTPIHPIRLVHELQTLLSDDMTLCLDMGSFHIWMARYLYSFRARQILMTNGQQKLGVGLPWAIAASLVRPSEKVISVSGDGGFLFSAMELETAVRLKSNLVHLVWIDGFYDMVGFQEMAKYGRLSGVTLGPVDVVRYAEAFGAKGLKIERPEEISSTLKKALAIEGPVIVGVPVDYRDNHRLMEDVHPEALN